MLPFLYRAFKKQVDAQRDKGFYILSSQHFDADLMACVTAYFGLHSLKGSSTRGGTKVLVESIRLLRKGCDIGVSPDGPKGPYHHIADGVFIMSKATQRPIIPMRVVYSRCWRLKSWDRFCIPKPFSRVDYHLLEGFVVTREYAASRGKRQIATSFRKGTLNACISWKLH